jgi:hypothetical protein
MTEDPMTISKIKNINCIMYIGSSCGSLKFYKYDPTTNQNEKSVVCNKKAISSGNDSLIFPLYPKFILAVSKSRKNTNIMNERMFVNSGLPTDSLKIPVGINITA